jgi:hypothetical protein
VSRTYDDPTLAALYTTTAVEPAKKFYVFHQRHFGKFAYVEEGSSPAENAVIAASHPQQNTCVMSKAVRESINQASRQADSEVPSSDIRIFHDAPNLIQTGRRNFGVHVDKPKDVTIRGARAGIHLAAAIALALNKLITKTDGKPICAIGASAVRDNNLSSGHSLAQMFKKRSYQRRLVEYRNNDRELRSNTFL